MVAALYKSTLSSGTYIRAVPTLLFVPSVGTETGRHIMTPFSPLITALPIVVTPRGMSRTLRLVQEENALSPSFTIDSGRRISSSVVSSNPEAERP